MCCTSRTAAGLQPVLTVCFSACSAHTCISGVLLWQRTELRCAGGRRSPAHQGRREVVVTQVLRAQAVGFVRKQERRAEEGEEGWSPPSVLLLSSVVSVVVWLLHYLLDSYVFFTKNTEFFPVLTISQQNFWCYSEKREIHHQLSKPVILDQGDAPPHLPRGRKVISRGRDPLTRSTTWRACLTNFPMNTLIFTT